MWRTRGGDAPAGKLVNLVIAWIAQVDMIRQQTSWREVMRHVSPPSCLTGGAQTVPHAVSVVGGIEGGPGLGEPHDIPPPPNQVWGPDPPGGPKGICFGEASHPGPSRDDVNKE